MQRYAATSHVESARKMHGIVGRPSDGRDGLEKWKTTSGERNSVAKSRSLAAIFFFIAFASMSTSPETAIFAGKVHLKITLLVKTPLHEYREVARSG